MAEDEKPAQDKKVDEDWKKQAQSEKDKLREKMASEGSAAGKEFTMPDASFQTLVTSLVTQALIGLGEVKHPMMQEATVDLDTAKFAIDTIQMLKEKTQGNLTDQEQKYVEAVLYDLRLRFVAAASPGSIRPPEDGGGIVTPGA